MLAKGTTFSCFTEAETALNLLRTSDGHPLRVFNSQTAEDYNKKQLLLKVAGQTVDPNQFKYTYYCVRCVHYGTPRYRGKAISPRPLQRSFAMECKAKVTITYSKISKCLVVKECNLHHNHRIGPEILKHYPSARRLSVEEKQHVTDLLNVKACKKHVKDLVHKKYGKLITIKDIQNLKTKMNEDKRSGSRDSQLLLDKLVKELSTDHGSFGGVVLDENDTIAIVYYQSSHITWLSCLKRFLKFYLLTAI